MRFRFLVAAGCLLGACSSTTDLVPEEAPDRPASVDRVPSRTVASAQIVSGGESRESDSAQSQRPKNLVLFIADGFGPASATMGRAAKGAPLSFDSVLVGAVETSASDSRVTDSAASATAYACGLKTYNGAIGVDASGAPCRTILERAEAAGLATGLVATSRITHATPAAFAAHVAQRSQEGAIASQMLTSGVDLLVGGGRKYFRGPLALRDLLAEAEAADWTVALERPGFDALEASPALVLLADDHLAYEVDRDPQAEPSLAEMTRRALDLLSNSADGETHGFFVMIEGSRIDHAGHANDPAGHLGDILAYDAAVAEALAWAAADGETLVVSTADHETGGMTLGKDGVYAWDPAPVLAATASFEAIAARLIAGDDPAEVIERGLGLPAVSDSVAAVLRAAAVADTLVGTRLSYLPSETETARLLRELASNRANVGWTTGGHTAVDVGLYAWGPGAEALRGAMPNDALGRRLVELLLGGD